MKKAFLGFITFLMLTPSLACAMEFCPMMYSESQMPCHEVSDEDGIMFVLDCMGVDLFQQDISNDFQFDQSMETVGYDWVDLNTRYNFQPQHNNGIRGPPITIELTQTEPSLILTTQRFRI